MKDYLAALAANYLGLALTMAIQVMLLPFLLNRLGPDLTGLYYLFMTVSNFVAVGIGWLSGAGVYLLASSDSGKTSGSVDDVHYVVFLGFFAYSAIIFIVMAVWGLSAGTWWLGDAGAAVTTQARNACFLLGLYIWVSYVHNADISLYTATLRQGWANLYRIVSQIVFLLAVVFYVVPDPGLDKMMAANLSGSVVVAFAARLHLRLSGILGPFRLRMPDRALVKKMFLAKGGPYFIFGVAQMGLIYGDVLIIGAVMGPAMVSAYLVIWKIPEVIALILGRISEILSPYLTRIESRGGPRQTAPVFLCVSRFQHCLGLAAGAGYAFFGPAIVALWVGEANRPDVAWYYWAAGGALAIQVANRHDVVLHYALASLGRLVVAQFAELILKVALMIALFDAYGVAAPLVALLVIQLCGLTWYYRNSSLKRIESGWNEWFRDVGIRAISCFSAAVCVLFVIYSCLPMEGRTGFFVPLFIYLLATFGIVAGIEKGRKTDGLFRLRKLLAKAD